MKLACCVFVLSRPRNVFESKLLSTAIIKHTAADVVNLLLLNKEGLCGFEGAATTPDLAGANVRIGYVKMNSKR